MIIVSTFDQDYARAITALQKRFYVIVNYGPDESGWSWETASNQLPLAKRSANAADHPAVIVNNDGKIVYRVKMGAVADPSATTLAKFTRHQA